MFGTIAAGENTLKGEYTPEILSILVLSMTRVLQLLLMEPRKSYLIARLLPVLKRRNIGHRYLLYEANGQEATVTSYGIIYGSTWPRRAIHFHNDTTDRFYQKSTHRVIGSTIHSSCMEVLLSTFKTTGLVILIFQSRDMLVSQKYCQDNALRAQIYEIVQFIEGHMCSG